MSAIAFPSRFLNHGASIRVGRMRGFYGMTTTGGVAWRRRKFGGFMFTMLRRVIAMQAGLLIAAIAVPHAARAQAMPPEVQVGARTIADYEFDWGRDGTYRSTCNYGSGNNRLVRRQ
ncbi:MAG: hypothetical protein U1F20_00870 [Lysobacterales bacterium]